ncbi:MAG: histidinol-phosphate transaminase [bacterium]
MTFQEDEYLDLVNPHILKISPYVPGKPIEEVQREFGLKEVHKLASNESAVGTSRLAMAAIRKVLDDLYLYPDSNNYYLKQRLSQHFSLPPDHFLVAGGSVEILYFIAVALLSKQDEAVTGIPSFAMYPIVTQMVDATLVKVGLRNDCLDLEAMAEAITDRTKIVFIANPNNPTGTIVTASQVRSFMAKVPPRVLVVFDEAYFDFVESTEYPDCFEYLQQGRRVLLLRTFSKNYGLAGARVGYAIGAPGLIRIIERVQPPFNVSTPAQVAAIAAFDDRDHLEETRKVTWKEKQFLYEGFMKLGIEFAPTESNFIYVRSPIPVQVLFYQLLTEGVVIRPVGPMAPNHVRISIGNRMNNTFLLESLGKILTQVSR